MKHLFLLFVIIKMNCAVAQHKKDSLDIYLSKLNWNSVTITPTFIPRLLLDDEAKKILMLKDARFNQRLFERLDENEKTLALHILLTERLSPSTENMIVLESYVYQNDTIAIVKYNFNKLDWSLNLKTGKYFISKSAINRIKAYWRNKLKILNSHF